MQQSPTEDRYASTLARFIAITWLLSGWLLASFVAGGLYSGISALESLVRK
jgi:hypothetical protein